MLCEVYETSERPEVYDVGQLSVMYIKCTDLLWEDVVGSWEDVSDEGAVLDVLVITDDMNCIITRLSGPVLHITGAITLIITVNLSLGWTLNGEA